MFSESGCSMITCQVPEAGLAFSLMWTGIPPPVESSSCAKTTKPTFGALDFFFSWALPVQVSDYSVFVL